MKLGPAKNLRSVVTRCCASCEYLQYVEDAPRRAYLEPIGYLKCRREGGFEHDVEEATWMVCDGYKRDKS